MTDVIDLAERRKPAEPPAEQPRVVWTCNCGCQSFYIHPDHVECCSCGSATTGPGTIADWRIEPGEPRPERPDTFVVTHLDTPDLARARVLRRAQEPDTRAIIAVKDTGGMIAWGLGSEDEEQYRWWRRRVAELRRLVRQSHRP